MEGNLKISQMFELSGVDNVIKMPKDVLKQSGKRIYRERISVTAWKRKKTQISK